MKEEFGIYKEKNMKVEMVILQPWVLDSRSIENFNFFNCGN